MLSFLRLLALVTVVYCTTVSEKNCTTPDGKWAPNAVACDDVISPTVCASLISPAPTINVGTEGDERGDACFKSGTTPSEEQKQAMIKMCPKTCGYCCLTDAYKCKNKEFPGVKCETITQSQCKDPKWREIIASECPSACGFCLQGGCVDAVIECENDPTICRNIDMQPFVQANCKKTCGFCDKTSGSSTTAGYPGGVTGTPFRCYDWGNNCAHWKTTGFCTSTFYSLSQKMQYCARTCGFCT